MAVSTSDMWNSNFGVLGTVRDKAFAAMSQLESQALSSANAIYITATTAFDTPNVTYIDVATLPSVAEIMAGVADIAPDPSPALGAGVVETYRRHVWEDARLESLLTTVMAYADSGGLPSAEVQNAIFDQDRERKQKALADSIDLIKAQTSGRGFRYANGQTNAALLDLMQKHQYDLENQSREIARMVQEWARQNFQFAIQQGVAIEQLQMDFSIRFSSVVTAHVSAILEKYRTQVQVELEKMDANVKSVMTRAEAYKANADISTVAGRLQLEKYQLDIQQNLGRFQGTISNINNTTGRQLNAAIAYAETTRGLIQATTNNVLGVVTQKIS